MELDDGTTLTENAAVLQWIVDTYGPKPSSDLERAKLVQELSYISSELHKAFSPFFAAVAPEGEARDALIAKLRTRIAHYEATYLQDDRGFGVAEIYAFVVLCWAGYQKIDISDFTAVAPFLAKIGERPSVKAAIEAEMALVRSIDEYLPVVAARQSPLSLGEQRNGAVESIDLAGENTALVRLRCSLNARHYTDFLSLIKEEGRWQIIAKVFQFQETRGD